MFRKKLASIFLKNLINNTKLPTIEEKGTKSDLINWMQPKENNIKYNCYKSYSKKLVDYTLYDAIYWNRYSYDY